MTFKNHLLVRLKNLLCCYFHSKCNLNEKLLQNVLIDSAHSVHAKTSSEYYISCSKKAVSPSLTYSAKPPVILKE